MRNINVMLLPKTWNGLWVNSLPWCSNVFTALVTQHNVWA